MTMVNAAKISFFLNGARVTTVVPPGMTALAWLREVRGLTGTREGCGEGDCGACTVAVGAVEAGRVVYRAVNACLYPMVKLHGTHLVTIEGIATPALHAIQKAIVRHHATQCGFCTPGIVMSLFCLIGENPEPDDEEIKAALEGNLCRCTGYASILEAARAARGASATPSAFGDVDGQLTGRWPAVGAAALPCEWDDGCTHYHLPRSVEELFHILGKIGDCDHYRIVAGGTDLAVGMNIFGRRYRHLVDISRIPGLDAIEERDGGVQIGPNVTFGALVRSPIVKRALPALRQAAARMGSAQIRNVATLAGNLGNASPIGDGGVALLALGARLHLMTSTAARVVPLDDYFLDYKKTCLGEREVIARIEVPVESVLQGALKSAKRGAVDIATVNSAIAIRPDGDRIAKVRLAFGGVAPTPILARKTMQFLEGKTVDGKVVGEAALIAASEVAPISDVRGSAAFRRVLVRNSVVRHFQTLWLG